MLKSLPFCFGISFFSHAIYVVQDWANCVLDANWVHLGVQNVWGAPKFFVREENRFADFKSNRSNNEKIKLRFKCYGKHQPTCNKLIYISGDLKADLFTHGLWNN